MQHKEDRQNSGTQHADGLAFPKSPLLWFLAHFSHRLFFRFVKEKNIQELSEPLALFTFTSFSAYLVLKKFQKGWRSSPTKSMHFQPGLIWFNTSYRAILRRRESPRQLCISSACNNGIITWKISFPSV